MLGEVTSVGIWSKIPNKQPLPSVFHASSKNYHERSTKLHNIHPLSVIGWNTIFQPILLLLLL